MSIVTYMSKVILRQWCPSCSGYELHTMTSNIEIDDAVVLVTAQTYPYADLITGS